MTADRDERFCNGCWLGSAEGKEALGRELQGIRREIERILSHFEVGGAVVNMSERMGRLEDRHVEVLERLEREGKERLAADSELGDALEKVNKLATGVLLKVAGLSGLLGVIAVIAWEFLKRGLN